MGVGGMYHLYKGDIVGLSNRNMQTEENKVDRHQGCPRVQTRQCHLIWLSQWAGESTDSETETQGHTYWCWEPPIQCMMGREFFSVITWLFSRWPATMYSQRHLPCRGLPRLVTLVSEPTLYPGAYANTGWFVLLCGCQVHEEKEALLFGLWGASSRWGRGRPAGRRWSMENITCHKMWIAGQGHPNASPGNNSPCEWNGAMAVDGWGQPDVIKLNQQNLAKSRQISIITEALVNAIKSNTCPGEEH